MAARFVAVGGPNQGFDASAIPPWLMVAKGTTKIVNLVSGRGLTVDSAVPAVATVIDRHGPTRASRQIIIKGVAKGHSTIRALSGRTVRARLSVGVKDKKTVKTAFHFVHDSAAPPHQTRRTHAEVGPMLVTVNAIFLPQTNIEFTSHLVRNVTVASNLGRTVIDRSGHARDEWGAVIAHGDATADFNVFFVWRLEQHGSSGDEDAVTEVGGRNCLFEDRAGRQTGETLAHEAGHFLGVNADPRGHRNWLMHAFTDVRRRHIPKRHANIMNP